MVRKIYSSDTVRAEAHDARVLARGGRILKVRLDADAASVIEKALADDPELSANAVINLALKCYKLPGKG